MESPHHYRAFGLNVLSDLEMPSWLPGAAPWDVRIAWGDVPAHLAEAETLWNGAFAGRRGVAWLNYPEVGRVLVENGDRLTVSPGGERARAQLPKLIAGTGFAALWYQRGALCLHASSIGWQGRAYLIMGPSGAGKSTTASALLARGGEFISDDVTIVTPGADGQFLATPSYPAIRLRTDSHEQLGERIAASEQPDPVDPKVRLRYRGTLATQALPIARICFLHFDDALVTPRRELLLGHERVSAVQRSLFRRRMGRIVADPRHLMEASVALSRRVDLVRLIRPSKGFALDELCQLAVGP